MTSQRYNNFQLFHIRNITRDYYKPFLTNKVFFTSENITIKNKGKLISDNLKLTETFNTHYINIVENSSGIPPYTTGNPDNPLEDSNTVKNIIEEYENHPSIINIWNQTNLNVNTFDFPHAIAEEINKIIEDINPKEATGPDKIPPKIIKLSANTTDSHFTNLINQDIDNNRFPENAKTPSVRPIFNKKEREKVENYRPVSIPNCFSKIYKKYILEKFKSFMNLNQFISAYGENYSSCHVLTRLIENWKEFLGKGFATVALLMDLSKALDCIPHDLLVAKLHVYGINLNAATFIYSYLETLKTKCKNSWYF